MQSSYLPSLNISDYQDLMIQKYPKYYMTLFLDHPNAIQFNSKMNIKSDDVRENRTKLNNLVRLFGVKQILKYAIKKNTFQTVPKDYRILDVLGGAGMLAKVFRYLTNNPADQTVFTSDAARDLVYQALKNNLPAIRELAQGLMLRNESFDAVIISNGSHRIVKKDRLTIFQEAMRVLKPQGVLVFHGFENNSPMTRWYTEVVDNYSSAGRKRDMFDQKEIQDCFEQSGFEKIKIQSMYDPFIATGATAKQARNRLADYVVNIYGLEKLKHQPDKVLSLLENYFSYQYDHVKEVKPSWKKSLSVYQTKTGFYAELPRVALVGTGRKPR